MESEQPTGIIEAESVDCASWQGSQRHRQSARTGWTAGVPSQPSHSHPIIFQPSIDQHAIY